jgi:hypothetical protein
MLCLNWGQTMKAKFLCLFVLCAFLLGLLFEQFWLLQSVQMCGSERRTKKKPTFLLLWRWLLQQRIFLGAPSNRDTTHYWYVTWHISQDWQLTISQLFFRRCSPFEKFSKTNFEHTHVHTGSNCGHNLHDCNWVLDVPSSANGVLQWSNHILYILMFTVSNRGILELVTDHWASSHPPSIANTDRKPCAVIRNQSTR